jgi:hypothetical protein
LNEREPRQRRHAPPTVPQLAAVVVGLPMALACVLWLYEHREGVTRAVLALIQGGAH